MSIENKINSNIIPSDDLASNIDEAEKSEMSMALLQVKDAAVVFCSNHSEFGECFEIHISPDDSVKTNFLNQFNKTPLKEFDENNIIFGADAKVAGLLKATLERSIKKGEDEKNVKNQAVVFESIAKNKTGKNISVNFKFDYPTAQKLCTQLIIAFKNYNNYKKNKKNKIDVD